LGGAQLYPQTEIYRDAQSYFGYPYTRLYSSMLIEPHTYLRALLRDFYIAGGRVEVREFRTREEIARLREQVIFNCTGRAQERCSKTRSSVRCAASWKCCCRSRRLTTVISPAGLTCFRAATE
jgi:hypothetical protein